MTRVALVLALVVGTTSWAEGTMEKAPGDRIQDQVSLAHSCEQLC